MRNPFKTPVKMFYPPKGMITVMAVYSDGKKWQWERSHIIAKDELVRICTQIIADVEAKPE